MPSASLTARLKRLNPKAIKTVHIVAAVHKPRIFPTVTRVASWFARQGVQPFLAEEQASALSLPKLAGSQAELDKADLLVSMGGDGTLLAAARIAAPRRKPIVGINLGGFGFLATILPGARLLDSLAEMMEERCEIQERMMLAARVMRRNREVASFFALNDVVVGKGAFARLLRLETSISGKQVFSFPADGMIVSTPTGSTAYTLAAGGPVVAPNLRAIIITPVCPHAISACSLVVSSGSIIDISLPDPRIQEVNCTADGQEGISLHAGDRIEVREAPFSARIISLKIDDFFAKLQNKMGWGNHR